jgi:hypothetical protein
MSFAAPLFVWVGAAASLALVALHLLAWRRPPMSRLPTARFIPEAPLRTVSRAVRPADLALLALRVLVVLLVAGGLAGPRLTARAQGTARVIVVDQSPGGQVATATAAVARAAFRRGDALVLFDSAARAVANPTVDSIVAGEGRANGSVSAALIVAIRAATALQRERDSVEIVLVSPFASDELDAATGHIRRAWPGAVRPVRAGAPPNDTTPRGRVDVRAAPGDPVVAALALSGATPVGNGVRVARDTITAADSAWAREGHAIVAWPASGTMTGWQTRARPDTAFGVSILAPANGSGASAARTATVVAPFQRRATPPAGRVLARWEDGEPAVTESALGAGCVRSAAVTVPAAGDLVVTPAFRRFAEQLVLPCAGSRSWTPVSDSTLLAVLPRSATPDSTVRVAAVSSVPGRSTAGAWMLGLALVAALAELLLRRGANATA